MVKVFSTPGCVQCNATYRRLDAKGISYKIIDITVDESAREEALALGHIQAPVVVTADKNWSGYRPDLIDELA